MVFPFTIRGRLIPSSSSGPVSSPREGLARIEKLFREVMPEAPERQGDELVFSVGRFLHIRGNPMLSAIDGGRLRAEDVSGRATVSYSLDFLGLWIRSLVVFVILSLPFWKGGDVSPESLLTGLAISWFVVVAALTGVGVLSFRALIHEAFLVRPEVAGGEAVPVPPVTGNADSAPATEHNDDSKPIPDSTETVRSSSLTALFKFVLPAVFVPACLYLFVRGPVGRAADGNAEWWYVKTVAFAVLGAGFLFWTGIRLKKVSIEGDHLVLTNYRRSVKVPVGWVEKVETGGFRGLELITLDLGQDRGMGRWIVFMAPYRLMAEPEEHPVATRIRALSKHSKQKR